MDGKTLKATHDARGPYICRYTAWPYIAGMVLASTSAARSAGTNGPTSAECAWPYICGNLVAQASTSAARSAGTNGHSEQTKASTEADTKAILSPTCKLATPPEHVAHKAGWLAMSREPCTNMFVFTTPPGLR